MTLLRSITTVGGYTGISRILGLVRDVLIAQAVGADEVADAFFVAFRLPNMFRRIFAEGAFNAAFVPLFSRRLEQENATAAKTFAEESFSALAFCLLPLLVVVIAAMPWVMLGLAPGFESGSAKFLLAVDLARITFPYLLFISLTALLSGLLNALYRFSASAAAPILLNIFFILALTLVLPATQHPGHVLAWTVAFAGLAQFIMLWVAAARAGMALRLPRPRLTPGVRRLLRLMAPGIISAGALQINLLVGTIIASQEAGAVSFLYYADRLYQLPLGLIGIAFGVVLLPDLARKLRAGEDKAARSSLNRGLELALLVTLPAAVALMVIPEPIIFVLFEHGALTRADSQAIAAALIAFSAGLPAFVLIKVLQPAFYAREDTKTPLKHALWSVAANVLLSLALFPFIGHVGIAVSTSLAAWLNASALALELRVRGNHRMDSRLFNRLPRILSASLAMGLALWVASLALAEWVEGTFLLQLVALVLLVIGGLAVYAAVAAITGAARPREMMAQFRGQAGETGQGTGQDTGKGS